MEYQKNEDGTDKLDENGNPIPVEITPEVVEDDKDTTINNLVEELKAERLAKGILADLLKDKKEEVTPAVLTEDDKIAQKVKEILQQEKSSNAQNNKKLAFEKFISDNKEFHPENDSLGLKRGALERKFNQFNTAELETVEQFLSVIGDAKRLLVGNDTPQETPSGVKIQNSPTPKTNPPSRDSTELSPKEQKLAETTGRTKEQILKLKAKHPDLLEGLLEHVRD